MISGAIFDVDGVLLDSMGIWDEMGTQYIVRQGREPQPDLAQVLLTKHLSESAQFLREQYSLPWSEEEILEQIIDMMEEFYSSVIPPKPGVKEFLQQLKQSGIPVTVATAGDRKLAAAGLESGGLLPYIDEIFTCGEVGAGKDTPKVYQAARESMGTDLASTWVFEDSLHGILTAESAGFPTAGIYDKSSQHNIEKIRKSCTYYLEDFRKADIADF